MVKTITKIGNSQGIVFDSALMELAQLQTGDPVNITVHGGGTIVITPLRSTPSKEKVTSIIKETVKKYHKTLRRLA